MTMNKKAPPFTRRCKASTHCSKQARQPESGWHFYLRLTDIQQRAHLHRTESDARRFAVKLLRYVPAAAADATPHIQHGLGLSDASKGEGFLNHVYLRFLVRFYRPPLGIIPCK